MVLPDVRGLYRFYEELAVRLAEAGHDAIAIDYFGRTAGIGHRGDEFPYQEHVPQVTHEGLTADVAAAVGAPAPDQPGSADIHARLLLRWFQLLAAIRLAGTALPARLVSMDVPMVSGPSTPEPRSTSLPRWPHRSSP